MSEEATPARRPQRVFTLLIEVDRSPDDGLPAGATGAGMLCYASGVDEAEAVREAVAVLRQAGLSPLDVTGYGTEDERRADGHHIDAEEAALMARALADNAVIVAQVMPVMPDDAGQADPEGDTPPAPARPRPAAAQDKAKDKAKGSKPAARAGTAKRPPAKTPPRR